ncbi:hypothetical protein DCCM_0355 [Desulfocucumis palustris]|uniref:Uncharacterized protein n=1 Tax=Desulfocucumis palustris TaxID=1898651 RepID=A0A2L2X8B5_9FIRM|nr:hypothetical protein DCCM_0355 [Desulfocucumis palustris]
MFGGNGSAVTFFYLSINLLRPDHGPGRGLKNDNFVKYINNYIIRGQAWTGILF